MTQATKEPKYSTNPLPNTLLMVDIEDQSYESVLIDLDSCLLDFFGSFLPHLNAYTGKEFKVSDFYSFAIDEIANITREEVTNLLIECGYMLNMAPFSRTLEFIEHLRASGRRIVLSTSRVFDEICLEHTRKNLEMLGIYHNELHLVTGHKWNFKSDPRIKYIAYFDDAPHHIESYFSDKAKGVEVPDIICSPKLPYNLHLHAKYPIAHLDLEDNSIDFEQVIPTY